MPATAYHSSSSSPFPSIARHSSSMYATAALDSFQTQVSQLFLSLSGDRSPDLLSLPWIKNLLDAFLTIQESFHLLLSSSSSSSPKPPLLHRLLSDSFDRSLKALDVCNAVRDGIAHLRLCHRHLDTALSPLQPPSPLRHSHLRRSRRPLSDLTILILDNTSSSSSSAVLDHRNRSFGRNNKDTGNSNQNRHLRSLSWSVSRSWSAARQLQAIGNNLAAPRASDIAATNGLAVAVFTMNSVLLFVMWALVAAIPCQDRGLQMQFAVPRSFPWAAPVLALHDQILEESKKRERKNSSGLLREIHQMEKCSRLLMELTDTVQFPLPEEKEAEVRLAVEDLTEVCISLKEELDPLERKVREVFHRLVRSRTEGLDCLGKSHNLE